MGPQLSPPHLERLTFENLSSEEFLVLIIEAAKELNWNIGPPSETGFLGYRKQSTDFRREELFVEIDGKIGYLQSKYTGLQIANEDLNKENIENLIAKFLELKNKLDSKEVDQKYEVLRKKFVSKEISLLKQPPSTMKEDIAWFIRIFKPRPGYYISPIIIDLNAIIFFLLVIFRITMSLSEKESLIVWGANFTPLTTGGEWWRLLSCCFLHSRFLHLFGNMCALFYIGLLLEPILGKTRFITAYLFTGVVASGTSLWWHEKVLSAGASGAIFGMYGVFLAMLTTSLIKKSTRNALVTSIVFFVIYSLIGGMNYGIDNAAHIGGLISGIIIGYAFYPGLKNRSPDI